MTTTTEAAAKAGTGVWRFFAHEDDYPDLDEQACCERLGQALAIPTVSHMDPSLTDWSKFEALHAFMRSSFPHVFAAGEVTLVDQSLLIVLPGSDPALRPMMLMGHQDVVPVVAGTEADWTHDAFSGHVDDTFVWGRGAMDMKDQTIGELEAAEYALSHGWKLRRTLVLAFGQDEECLQSGSAALSAELARRGIELEFLVDEGDYRVVDSAEYGAPGGWLMHADLAEKGYADIELVTRSKGGHSSNPFGGTSLAVLAEAIARIARERWDVRITPLTEALLGELAGRITEGPLAKLGLRDAEDVRARAGEIAEACLRDRQLFPLVTTTCAPDVIEGSSSACNVMPQDMRAVINFRLLEGTTVARVLERCRELVADLPVEVSLGGGSSNPTPAGLVGGPGLELLRRVAGRYFQVPADEGDARVGGGTPGLSSEAGDGTRAMGSEADDPRSGAPKSGAAVDAETGRAPVTVVPSTVIGATDARMYAPLCDECLRFSAFVVDDDECARGVHGTNERITRRAYMQGIRFLVRLIEEACVR